VGREGNVDGKLGVGEKKNYNPYDRLIRKLNAYLIPKGGGGRVPESLEVSR